MYQRQCKRISLLMSLILFIMTFPANVLASEPELVQPQAITISSRDDFLDLAKHSSDEAYTKDKIFKITEDIDFTGAEYIPVSVFAGYIDGGGHFLKGISLSGNNSSTGVFRVITSGGMVENIRLQADIYEGRGSEDVGLLAGKNYGTISGCTVSGQIIAEKKVGGIVGHNMPGALMKNCINEAIVLGSRRAGGVTGFNEGTIDDCQSSGEINAGDKTAHEMIAEREDKEFELELADIRVLATGGIAGVNSGILVNSWNSGRVGQRNVGYMTGGIVGYERGILSGCKNTGNTYGVRNVGGIAGLFEPYMTHVYEKDSLDDAADEFDELTEEITELHKKVGAEDDKTQHNIDVIRNEVDALRETVKGYKTYYRNKDDAIESSIYERLDGIRGDLDDLDMHYKIDVLVDNSGNANTTIEKLEELLKQTKEAAASGVPVDMLTTLKAVYTIVSGINPAIDNAINKVSGSAKRANKKLDKQLKILDSLRGRMNELDDFLRTTYDSYEADLRNTSDDLNARINNIAAEMDTLNTGLKSSDKAIRDKVDSIDKTLNEVGDTIKQGFSEAKDVVNDIVTTDDVEEIFDDISDREIGTVSLGSISKCRNYGEIEANVNSGGIVGTIDVAAGAESDFEVVSSGQVSMKYRSEKKALIYDCMNKGDIWVKNNYAGGIVGRADSGAVVSCNSFANVYSEDGDHVGGIAGRSGYTIRGCYAMVSVSGGDYVGGIAGLAHNLYENTVYANVSNSMERHGAVAGSLEDDADVNGNVYVKNAAGAIYGSAADKECRAVSYEELCNMEDVPSEFETVVVTYVDGDNIERREYPYGTHLTSGALPLLKTNDEVSYWNLELGEPIENNMIVVSKHVPWISTVATEEAVPKLLMNGHFYASTVLTMEDQDTYGAVAPPKYKVISKHGFTVSSDYGIPEQDYTLRYLNTEKADAVAIKENGQLRIVDTGIDGNYIIFNVKNTDEFYCLKKVVDLRVYIIVALLVILAGAFTIYFKKKGKKA